MGLALCVGHSRTATNVGHAWKATNACGKLDFDIAQMSSGLKLPVPSHLNSAKEKELYSILLSPNARSDGKPPSVQLSESTIPMMNDDAIRGLFARHVPGLGGMLDRTGQQPVCHYICLTYRSGLPAQSGVPAVQRHTKLALRWLLHVVSDAGDHPDCSKKVLCALAEAYQSCQQTQARVIDTLFGALSGRDQGLRDQLLTLVDIVKQQTLDTVTLKLHPDCLSPWADMEQQMAHIQSAYTVACGELLGLRGMDASRVDRMKPRLSQGQIARFVSEYASSFPVDEVVKALVRDVNQTADNADRLIDPMALLSWANQASEADGFDKQGIFYQDDCPSEYSLTGVPANGSDAERLLMPWLHPDLALDVFCLGLRPQEYRMCGV